MNFPIITYEQHYFLNLWLFSQMLILILLLRKIIYYFVWKSTSPILKWKMEQIDKINKIKTFIKHYIKFAQFVTSYK